MLGGAAERYKMLVGQVERELRERESAGYENARVSLPEMAEKFGVSPAVMRAAVAAHRTRLAVEVRREWEPQRMRAGFTYFGGVGQVLRRRAYIRRAVEGVA